MAAAEGGAAGRAVRGDEGGRTTQSGHVRPGHAVWRDAAEAAGGRAVGGRRAAATGAVGGSDPLEPLRAPGRGGCVAATRGVNMRLVRAGAPRA